MNTTADTDMLRAAEEGNAMLERIEALQPMLLANAELARSERRVPQENIEVVDSLFSSAGGSSVFQGSAIQQCFLDIHTARAHVANNPTSFARNLGAVALGTDNSDFFV